MIKSVPKEIVHILSLGRPLCGFADTTLKDWPAGHKWTGYGQLDLATCPDCIKRAKEKQTKQT